MYFKLKWILLFAGLFFAACASPLQRSEVNSWLKYISGGQPSTINVQGVWLDEEPSGWGKMTLKQEGDRISGKSGAYELTGVVSGTKVYLVALYQNRVYYTLKLILKDDGSLDGAYYENRDTEQEFGTPNVFKKVS